MIKDSIALSKEIRKCSLRMVYQAKAYWWGFINGRFIICVI